MASYVPVIKNDSGGLIFYVALRDQSNTKVFKANPTIAAGDFKVSIDTGALANLGTLPSVSPAGSVWVKITLSQAEINGDNIKLQCIDAAGAEWCDLSVVIFTAAAAFATPTNITAGTITTVTTLTNAPSDSSGVTTLLTRLSALRAGYLDNLSAGAAALESSLQGLITTIGASAAGVATAVWGAVTRTLTAGTNIVLAKGTGVTGFNDLSAAQVNAEADTALADVGLTTTITGRVDAAISTRLATSGYTAPLDAAGTRTAVGLGSANLDTQLDALPTNAELATALAAADDATLAAVAAAKAVVDAIKLSTDNLPSDPADQSLIIAATSALSSAIASSKAVVDAIKLQSDKLTFDGSNNVAANVKAVADTDIDGDGTVGAPWGPV